MSTPEGETPPRALVFAAVVGALLGYVGGAIAMTASVGMWSEALKRYAYMLQGGGGEGAYWGEPLSYAFMLIVIPNAANLGGAMVGAAAAAGLARAVASAGGMVAFLRRYAVPLSALWLLTAALALVFVRVQWNRARADVARYREATAPRSITWVSPDPAILYERGCNGADAPSCREMGTLSQRGAPGVPPDLGRARSLYEKACGLGDGWSCLTAGLMHERGQSTPKDFAQAAAFYRKSCDLQYGMGCQYLGDSYAHGEGAPRDEARSRALYSQASALHVKACDEGDAHSCFALGTMYRIGQGVPVDVPRAQTLLARACRGGTQEACAAAGMSPPTSPAARP